MKNIIKSLDKGTVIRTVLLFIALFNQTLIMFGKPIIPIEEGQITSLVDGIYLVGSVAFTIVTTVVAWFKNNYVTQKGNLQKKALQSQGLIKK
ncbi:SPP1 family holin [Metabacillus niabensis]|uniref:SPP1 family holin n=1 Tax=Metabacillus niabensis TaxID=324854 RepID=A0ABT9Z814_9BACI|nr:SPP1 family holin [Metabacillus niabensis]